jgi:hypothetical protein
MTGLGAAQLILAACCCEIPSMTLILKINISRWAFSILLIVYISCTEIIFTVSTFALFYRSYWHNHLRLCLETLAAQRYSAF